MAPKTNGRSSTTLGQVVLGVAELHVRPHPPLPSASTAIETLRSGSHDGGRNTAAASPPPGGANADTPEGCASSAPTSVATTAALAAPAGMPNETAGGERWAYEGRARNAKASRSTCARRARNRPHPNTTTTKHGEAGDSTG